MTEPVFSYEDPASEAAWFAWLQDKSDQELTHYWHYIRNWAPADDPRENPDDMQMKYELAAQEMDGRGL